MNGRVLLDTNVLVYAEDSAEPLKRDRAQRVIEGVRFLDPFAKGFDLAALVG